MKCEKCNNEINNTMDKCPNCGNEIKNINLQQTMETNNTIISNDDNVPKKKKSNVVIIVIILIIFLIIALGVTIYSRNFNNTDDNNDITHTGTIYIYTEADYSYTSITKEKEYIEEKEVLYEYKCLSDCLYIDALSATEKKVYIFDDNKVYLLNYHNEKVDIKEIKKLKNYRIDENNLDIMEYNDSDNYLYVINSGDKNYFGGSNNKINLNSYGIIVSNNLLANNLIGYSYDNESYLYNFKTKEKVYESDKQITKGDIISGFVIIDHYDYKTILTTNYNVIKQDVNSYDATTVGDKLVIINSITDEEGNSTGHTLDYYTNDGSLVHSSEMYSDIQILLDKYAVMNMDNRIVIVELTQDYQTKIVADFAQYPNLVEINPYYTKYENLDRGEGLYFNVIDQSITVDEFLKDNPDVTREDAEEMGCFGYWYYFIPSTGEIGRYTTTNEMCS